MGNVAGSHQFPAEIYTWEETDPVQGGDDGIDNVPIKELANRTRYLKDLSSLKKSMGNLLPFGSFGNGFTLTSYTQSVYDEISGSWFYWVGALPKVVSPLATPASTGGIYDSVTNISGKWVSVDSSLTKCDVISDLSIKPKVSGFTVKVDRYSSDFESGEGGGYLTYNPSRSSENDLVSVFNGWVREKTGIITSDDAGCTESSADSTDRLTTLFSLIEDGDKVEITRELQISKNFVIKNKSNFSILKSGTGKLTAWANRSTFSLLVDSDFEYGYGSLGILSLYGCSNVDISLDITGAQYQLNSGREWGDCAVRYESCSRVRVFNSVLTRFAGWGVIGMYSDNSEVFDNDISFVSRQSGINIFACSSNSKAYRNNISYCGLYGIECETFPSKANSVTTGNQAFDNKISFCKYGICAVGNHNDFDIYSNQIYGCSAGIIGIRLLGDTSTNIGITYNRVINCIKGISVNNSYRTHAVNNVVKWLVGESYYTTNQYSAVLSVKSDNSGFFSEVSYPAGYKLQIEGNNYTVASSTSVTAQDVYGKSPYYGVTTLYFITLNETMVDVYPASLIFVSVDNMDPDYIYRVGLNTNLTASGSTTVDGMKDVLFQGNRVSGYDYGMIPNSQYTSATTGISEVYDGNSFSGCAVWLRLLRPITLPVSISNNTRSTSPGINISSSGGDSTNWRPTEKVVFEGKLTSGSAGDVHYHVTDEVKLVVGYRVTLIGWSSSTEDISLKVDNSNLNKITDHTVSTSGSSTVVKASSILHALAAGTPFPVSLYTPGNTASAGYYRIEVFLS